MLIDIKEYKYGDIQISAPPNILGIFDEFIDSNNLCISRMLKFPTNKHVLTRVYRFRDPAMDFKWVKLKLIEIKLKMDLE